MNTATNGFLLSLSLCLDIGIVNIAMMGMTLQRGYWSGFCVGLGSCVGDLIYAICALIGMRVLLQFEIVRWIMWLGGTTVLLLLAIKMLALAYQPQPLQRLAYQTDRKISSKYVLRQVGYGMALALSSPSAILWFAAVGGALIAQIGTHDQSTMIYFLLGFFSAGICWSFVVCTFAYYGRKIVSAKILSYCYLISAILFLVLAGQIALTGYQTFL